MGTSGARPGRLVVVAMIATMIAAACASGGSTGLAGTASGSLVAPSEASEGATNGLIGGAPSAEPVSPPPSTTPKPKLTPRPTASPKPKPTACRGVIPGSLSALEGLLRHPIGATTTASLWYVVDGDTIRLSNGEYVRLIGMDTPETVKPGTPVQRYGPQASADLKRLLAGRSSVVLEKDVSNTDWYGRLLRFVWIRSGSAWLQLDYELVVRGDARIDTIAPDVRYEADYASAERLAEAHHVGRWATC